MSVICKSSAGWLLDELSLLNKWYQHTEGHCTAHNCPSCKADAHSGTGVFCRFREDLFRVLKPHITLQSAAVLDPGKSQGTTTNRKKRKRSNAFNQGELDALEYHKKISDFILEGSQSLVQEGLQNEFLQPPSQKEDEKSEIVAGPYSTHCQLAELCDMAKQMSLVIPKEHTVQILGNKGPLPQDTDFLCCITENQSKWPQIIQLLGEKYVIPPNSSFLLSDITCMEPLLQYKRFNIIVIDPPWENKSVKRSKRYCYLSPMEIKQLPIPALAAPDCLVVTWVTNRQKHRRFVMEELYPHWSIKTLAEWHWVKITRSGEFVFPLDSPHKKPYEILILGRAQNEDNYVPRDSGIVLPPVPEHKLIVSVPCSLHSHKPLLSEVLKEYVKSDGECLELFARNLQSGWTSWGNEVLKFQHMDYFIPLETGN
ncbi:N(6)-adenine-specific methyltransferase METTL4 [Rhinophrynus dorsalis]